MTDSNDKIFDLIEGGDKLDLFDSISKHEEVFGEEGSFEMFSKQVYDELDKQSHVAGSTSDMIMRLEKSPELYNNIIEASEKWNVPADQLMAYGMNKGMHQQFFEGHYSGGYNPDTPLTSPSDKFTVFEHDIHHSVSESPDSKFKHGKLSPTGKEAWDSLAENLEFAQRKAKDILQENTSIDYESLDENIKNINTFLLLGSGQGAFSSVIEDHGANFIHKPNFWEEYEGNEEYMKTFDNMDRVLGSADVLKNLNVFDELTATASSFEVMESNYKAVSPHIKKENIEGKSTLSDFRPYEEWRDASVKHYEGQLNDMDKWRNR